MINNSSEPAGSPAMRIVYLRASNQTTVVVPPATDPAPITSAENGVLRFVSRPSASSALDPLRTDLPSTDATRPQVAMEQFAWQTAQAMLADPMQTLRSQLAPQREVVTGLLYSDV